MKVGTDSMLLGAFLNHNYKGNSLDIGAGTGVLSFMLTQNSPEIDIDSIEIDDQAFLELAENIQDNPFENKITPIHADFLKYDFNKKYNLIISNPPFFENSLKSELQQKNLARHTDSLSIQDLFLKVESLLIENGEFWLILPSQNQIPASSLYCVKRIEIFGKPSQLTRTIYCFTKKSSEEKEEKSFLIRDEFGNYTEEYKLLTKEFHNKVL